MYLAPHPRKTDRMLFYCPACDTDHRVITEGEGAWTLEDPEGLVTIKPSVRVQGSVCTRTNESQEVYCHFFVTKGKFHYCADSKHDLAGETVPMIPYQDT
jgi:hypothetical protein